MKAIRIVKCSDRHMWYAPYVGQLAAYYSEYDKEFLSKEPSGYSNIILKCDGELVDVTEDEWNKGRLNSLHEKKSSS